MQNINLYQAVRRSDGSQRQRQMLLGALALLLVCLLHGLWLGLELWRSSDRLAQAELAASQAEQALQAVQVGFVEPQLDPQLPLDLARQEADNQQLQRLVDYLQLLEQQRRRGFLAPLQALSERHPPSGLWLRLIRLEQGGDQLQLKGYSQDQELLPLYLHSLGQSEVFRGREFARFDLQREPDGLLQFNLSSHADAAEVAP